MASRSVSAMQAAPSNLFQRANGQLCGQGDAGDHTGDPLWYTAPLAGQFGSQTPNSFVRVYYTVLLLLVEHPLYWLVR